MGGAGITYYFDAMPRLPDPAPADLPVHDTPRAGLLGAAAAGVSAAAGACNYVELRKATRHIGQLYDDIFEASGLRAAQQGLLFFIDAHDGPTMKEMARAIVMDLSALGQTLKPLVRDGYVRLVPSETDGRAKRVYLTEAGRAKAREGVALWQQAQGRFEAALGSAEARSLRGALALIASNGFADVFRSAEPHPVRFALRGDETLPA